MTPRGLKPPFPARKLTVQNFGRSREKSKEKPWNTTRARKKESYWRVRSSGMPILLLVWISDLATPQYSSHTTVGLKLRNTPACESYYCQLPKNGNGFSLNDVITSMLPLKERIFLVANLFFAKKSLIVSCNTHTQNSVMLLPNTTCMILQ